MPPSQSELASTWLSWLNQVLTDHSFPLRAYNAPDDEDSGSEGDSFPTAIHIRSLRSQLPPFSIPVLIGVCADNDLPLDEYDNNPNAILSDQVFLQQIRKFCSSAPLRCFIARADGRISFYSLSDLRAGQNGVSTSIDVVEHGTGARSENGRAGWAEQMLVDSVKRNLAQVARIAPRFYQQAFL